KHAELAMLSVRRGALLERRLADRQLEVVSDSVDRADRYQLALDTRLRLRDQRPERLQRDGQHRRERGEAAMQARKRHRARCPESTGRITPVTQLAAGLAR